MHVVCSVKEVMGLCVCRSRVTTRIANWTITNSTTVFNLKVMDPVLNHSTVLYYLELLCALLNSDQNWVSAVNQPDPDTSVTYNPVNQLSFSQA